MQQRVNFVELDATSPDWPANDGAYEIVLMSHISGSVPESIIGAVRSYAPPRCTTRAALLQC